MGGATSVDEFDLVRILWRRTAMEGESVPRERLIELLDRLHHGPAQHASAAKVALAVWERAEEQCDATAAATAREMLRGSLADLLTSLTEVERLGREWAGGRRSAGSSPP